MEEPASPEQIQREAEQGVVWRMNQLGEMYRDGNHVPQDSQLAVRWFKKSAEADCPDAMFNLGMLALEQGNDMDAFGYFFQADCFNHVKAKHQLASILFKQKNYDQALAYANALLKIPNENAFALQLQIQIRKERQIEGKYEEMAELYASQDFVKAKDRCEEILNASQGTSMENKIRALYDKILEEFTKRVELRDFLLGANKPLDEDELEKFVAFLAKKKLWKQRLLTFNERSIKRLEKDLKDMPFLAVLLKQLCTPPPKPNPVRERHKASIISPNDLKDKQLIGEGNFGKVWIAKYEGELVAVKILKDTTASEEFLDEVAKMHNFQNSGANSNLVKLYGVCIDKPCGIVMEYMENGDLLSFLKVNPKQSLKQIFKWAINICDGMYFIHSQKFVHHDLALRNVLVDGNLVAKISDFGLAKQLAIAFGDETTSQTAKVDPISNPMWYPPESWLNPLREAYKTDVWGYGITVWEMVTLAPPYFQLGHNRNFESLRLLAKKNLAEMFFKLPSCPEVDGIIQPCLNNDRSQRPSFQQLCEILRSEYGRLDDHLIECGKKCSIAEEAKYFDPKENQPNPSNNNNPIDNVNCYTKTIQLDSPSKPNTNSTITNNSSASQIVEVGYCDNDTIRNNYNKDNCNVKNFNNDINNNNSEPQCHSNPINRNNSNNNNINNGNNDNKQVKPQSYCEPDNNNIQVEAQGYCVVS